MSFWSNLVDRSPQKNEPAPNITAPSGHQHDSLQVLEHADSCEVPDQSTANDEFRCSVEPYFFMIQYTDSNGATTRRRVTTHVVEQRSGHLYLYAFCHERHSVRSFRIDRISELVDQFGEVISPEDWLNDALDPDAFEAVRPRPKKNRQTAERSAASTKNLSPYTIFRRNITPAMIILCATARIDDVFHDNELETIMKYIEDEAFNLHKTGEISVALQVEDIDKVERTVRRLRPTRDEVEAAIRDIEPWDHARLHRLSVAIHATAKADGIIHEGEEALIAEIQDYGSRRFGFGWNG